MYTYTCTPCSAYMYTLTYTCTYHTVQSPTCTYVHLHPSKKCSCHFYKWAATQSKVVVPQLIQIKKVHLSASRENTDGFLWSSGQWSGTRKVSDSCFPTSTSNQYVRVHISPLTMKYHLALETLSLLVGER